MVEYLNELKITPTDCSPKMPHLGEEDNTALQQLLLASGLRNYGMEESKRLHKKPKLEHVDDSINNNYKAPKEEWKVMKFDHLSRETTPHYIKTALEEEHKALLSANNDLIEQRLLFEEENNDLRFFLGDDEDMVSLNVSGMIMVKKRSTLGLCKDSALANQFDEPLWT